MTFLAAAVLAAVTSVTDPRDSYPSPSPDGSQILFQTTRTGKRTIWISNSDGSEPRLLIDGGGLGSDPSTPVWAPDGRSIAFAMKPAGSALEGESDIYLASSDGSNVRRLTETPGDDSHPHWSADGTRIFFNSARSTPDLKLPFPRQWIDIYSMAADGSDVRRLTDCRTVCSYPVPSPDGRWIVYRKIIDGKGLDWDQNEIARNSEIFVTSIDNRVSRNLSTSPAFDGWPMWAAQGRWVVFSSNRDGLKRVGQVYAVRPDGTGLHALTAGTLNRVQISPTADSTKLYMAEHVDGPSGEFGHIAVIPLDLR